jgi:hypothetical protein
LPQAIQSDECFVNGKALEVLPWRPEDPWHA